MMQLLTLLPKVKGHYQQDISLSNMTWFRVGGAADIVFTPADESDLQHFLRNTPESVPVRVLGLGSNILIRDGGVSGVIIKLGKAFSHITKVSDNAVIVGSATPDIAVARFMARENISGMEFYRGIPGSIGGALRMNAGAYGSETSDILTYAIAIDRQGKKHKMTHKEMGFSYRNSDVSEDMIFVSALITGQCGDKNSILMKMDKICKDRENSQPVRSRTGGSTFRNPYGFKAWELIDKAGCRGMSIGGAQISEKHCNFLINTGTANATDLEMLGESIRCHVLAYHNIDLHWEIERIGKMADG